MVQPVRHTDGGPPEQRSAAEGGLAILDGTAVHPRVQAETRAPEEVPKLRRTELPDYVDLHARLLVQAQVITAQRRMQSTSDARCLYYEAKIDGLLETQAKLELRTEQLAMGSEDALSKASCSAAAAQECAKAAEAVDRRGQLIQILQEEVAALQRALMRK